MRELAAVGRGLELERFKADAGWGMPECMLLLLLFWLLEKPAMVCLM